MLQSISTDVTWMERIASPWDDISFDLKGDVTCGVVGCSNWMFTSLY